MKRLSVLLPPRISNSITNRMPLEAGEGAEVVKGGMIKTIKVEEEATRVTTSSTRVVVLTKIESQLLKMATKTSLMSKRSPDKTRKETKTDLPG